MEKGDQAINAEALFLLLLLLSRAVLNGLRKELPEERIRWLKPQFFDVSFFFVFHDLLYWFICCKVWVSFFQSTTVIIQHASLVQCPHSQLGNHFCQATKTSQSWPRFPAQSCKVPALTSGPHPVANSQGAYASPPETASMSKMWPVQLLLLDPPGRTPSLENFIFAQTMAVMNGSMG